MPGFRGVGILAVGCRAQGLGLRVEGFALRACGLGCNQV